MKDIIMSSLRIFVFLLLVHTSSAQVDIKPETARYFLETADERDLLKEKDSLQTKKIQGLETELFFKEQIITTYKTDDLLRIAEYNLVIDEYNGLVDELDSRDEDVRRLERNIKIRKYFEIAGGILAIILLL